MLMDGVFYSVFVGEKPISYGCGNVFRIEAAAGGIGQYGLGAIIAGEDDKTAGIAENVKV